ncbi:hypothetical protein ES705_48206 [subsurface metagenome]
MKKSILLWTKTTYVATFILLMLCFTLSCQQQAAIEQSEKEMKAMIEKLNNIWNSGDLAEIEEIFSSNWVCHLNNNEVDTISIDDYKQWVTSIRTTYPDFTAKTEQLIIKDDMIMWHWTITGTHNGTSGDSLLTGKKFKVPGVFIYRVVNGKIAKEWRFWNNALYLTQLGYTITPPSTAGEK